MTNEAIEAAALLPCPFCGGEAEYHKRHNTGATADWCGEVQHWVFCSGECGASTCLHDTEAEAIAAWNTRAAAPALMEEGARLALEAAAKLVGFNNFYRGAVNPYDNSLYTTLKSIESAIGTMDPAAIIKEAKK